MSVWRNLKLKRTSEDCVFCEQQLKLVRDCEGGVMDVFCPGCGLKYEIAVVCKRVAP